jgi:dTDP-4-amino-4,6-dideoxygalactose transaminase
MYLTKNARSAFLHILRRLRDDGYSLLLPSYIGMNNYEGSGVFDVVRTSRIEFEFCPVDLELSPEINHLEKIKGKKAILIIHYFGFPPNNFEQLLELAAMKSWLTIEDCAHTITSKYKGKLLGTIGDFAFHSIHKLLPTSDGGILRVNNSNYSFDIHPIEEGIKTETVCQYIRTNMNSISKERIDNYMRYLDLLSKGNTGFQVIHTHLADGVVPLNFPILIKTRKREEVYFELIERDVTTVSLYYQLIPEVLHKGYDTAEQISAQILNLPVHQDTSFEDIECVCSALKDVMAKS